jgi:hypothetical protein
MSPTEDPQYCFVAVDADGRSVEMLIRGHDDLAKKQYQGVWNKLAQAVQKQHQLGSGPPAPAWTTWKPWEWCDQQHGYEKRQKYVAWCGDNLVGFLNVWADFPSNHQPGKMVLYVEHLAAAPGNLSTTLWVRRFRSVGAALVAYAVLLSKQQGFEGRLGLHAADDEARGFYRHIHQKCRNGLFHPETSEVVGPTPRGEHERSNTYFETIETGAAAWLEGYRRA